MLWFTKWFKKVGSALTLTHRFYRRAGWLQTNDEDYEDALAAIALDIQKRQTRLSEIRLRERRATLLTTIYALAVWAVYVTVWYMGGISNPLGHQRQKTGLGKALTAAPVVIGPTGCVRESNTAAHYSLSLSEYCSFDESYRYGTQASGTQKVLAAPCTLPSRC